MTDEEKIELLHVFINTPETECTPTLIDDVLSIVKVDSYIQGCYYCVIEAALKEYITMKKKQEQTTPPETTPAYVLKEGVNVIFRGELINAATITDEKAADWIKRGFPLYYFDKYPEQ